MIKFLNKVKKLFSLSDRIHLIESELNELESKLDDSVKEYSKKFEKKIQEMTFNYTSNLDDTKSDYLKRYLETRLDCIQQELMLIPGKICSIENKMVEIESRISDEDEDLLEDFT